MLLGPIDLLENSLKGLWAYLRSDETDNAMVQTVQIKSLSDRNLGRLASRKSGRLSM